MNLSYNAEKALFYITLVAIAVYGLSMLNTEQMMNLMQLLNKLLFPFYPISALVP